MRKNTNNESDLPLTISSKDGLVDQISYFNKTVASKDMSGYYLLMQGEFAYNKSYSVGYDFGSIKRLDRYPKGALSTLYICFELTQNDSDFMKVYFDSLKWYKEIYMIAAEGARNHGLLNVPTDDFFDTKHTLPADIREQKKIAQFMILLEKRIEKQRQLVEALKSYKRGALSKLFPKKGETTPEYRFAGFTEPWEQQKWCDTVDMSKEMVDPRNGTYNNLPHVAPGNIESFTGRLFDNVKTVEQEELISGKFHFHAGDIIYCKINPQLGKYYFAQFEGLTSADAYVLNAKNGVIQDFLFAVLQTKDFFDYSVSVSKRSGMPKINREELNAYLFLAPSELEQEQIGAFLMHLDHLISAQRSRIDEYERMKAGLLQQLFI